MVLKVLEQADRVCVRERVRACVLSLWFDAHRLFEGPPLSHKPLGRTLTTSFPQGIIWGKPHVVIL